jgi:hypothetical protein
MDHLGMASNDTTRAIFCEWIRGPVGRSGSLLRLLRIDGFSKEARNSVHFGGQECRPKRRCLVFFNLGSGSQAGRRGFESRLPLHLFNKLESPGKTICSILLLYITVTGFSNPTACSSRLTACFRRSSEDFV